MRRTLALATIAFSFGAARITHAQSFEGVVTLADRTTPAANARVWLMGQRQQVMDTTRTDEQGFFRVRADRAGEYSLLIRRIGYASEETDKLFLAAGEVRRDTVYTLSPRELRPILVEVSRDAQRFFAMDLGQLGSRYIGPEQLDRARMGASDVVDLLRRTAPAGVLIHNTRLGVCVETRVQHGCAPVYLDGMNLGTDLPYISASDVQAIVVLRSLDGAMVGSRGAVMVYTGR